MKKLRFRALKDFWYMIGLWFVMRYNKLGAGDLLIRWGEALKNESLRNPDNK